MVCRPQKGRRQKEECHDHAESCCESQSRCHVLLHIRHTVNTVACTGMQKAVYATGKEVASQLMPSKCGSGDSENHKEEALTPRQQNG